MKPRNEIKFMMLLCGAVLFVPFYAGAQEGMYEAFNAELPSENGSSNMPVSQEAMTTVNMSVGAVETWDGNPGSSASEGSAQGELAGYVPSSQVGNNELNYKVEGGMDSYYLTTDNGAGSKYEVSFAMDFPAAAAENSPVDQGFFLHLTSTDNQYLQFYAEAGGPKVPGAYVEVGKSSYLDNTAEARQEYAVAEQFAANYLIPIAEGIATQREPGGQPMNISPDAFAALCSLNTVYSQSTFEVSVAGDQTAQFEAWTQANGAAPSYKVADNDGGNTYIYDKDSISKEALGKMALEKGVSCYIDLPRTISAI
jgi:hypothetical protein